MRGALLEEGCDGESVENALAQLEQWGYLDDLKLAREQLRRYTVRQPKGRLWIGRRLAREGFEPGHIRQVLDEYTADQEKELAVKTAEGFVRSRARRGYGRRQIGDALARFLAGRGFSSSLIYAIICEILGAFGEDIGEEIGEEFGEEIGFTNVSDLDSDENWH
jgi:regulatory protein